MFPILQIALKLPVKSKAQFSTTSSIVIKSSFTINRLSSFASQPPFIKAAKVIVKQTMSVSIKLLQFCRILSVRSLTIIDVKQLHQIYLPFPLSVMSYLWPMLNLAPVVLFLRVTSLPFAADFCSVLSSWRNSAKKLKT